MTKSGYIELLKVQSEGKKPLEALSWFRGLTQWQFDASSDRQSA